MECVESVLRVTNDGARGVGSSLRQHIVASGAMIGACLHRMPSIGLKKSNPPLLFWDQLTKVMDGFSVFNASTNNSYHANGNLVQSADGVGIQHQPGYDALNRLVQTIDNYNSTNRAQQFGRQIDRSGKRHGAEVINGHMAGKESKEMFLHELTGFTQFIRFNHSCRYFAFSHSRCCQRAN